jgi:hypothetical protein
MRDEPQIGDIVSVRRRIGASMEPFTCEIIAIDPAADQIHVRFPDGRTARRARRYVSKVRVTGEDRARVHGHNTVVPCKIIFGEDVFYLYWSDDHVDQHPLTSLKLYGASYPFVPVAQAKHPL